MDERAEEHEVDSSDSSAHYERNEVIMFVIGHNESSGVFLRDSGVVGRSSWTNDLEEAGSFASENDALTRAMQFGIYCGKFDLRPSYSLVLHQIEQGGRRLVKTV